MAAWTLIIEDKQFSVIHSYLAVVFRGNWTCCLRRRYKWHSDVGVRSKKDF